MVDHLIQTQRDFLSSHDLELPPAPDVSADPAAAWANHCAAVEELVKDRKVGEREYDGWFGRTTIGATLAQFYGWDMVVHRWDLARAVGADDTLSDEELDAVESALPAFGAQLYSEGICGPALQVDDDESRQVRVLALLGRDARS